MLIRKTLVAIGANALCLAAMAPVGAQNEAPFTIRKPPDGATVREKVRITVPLASIPEGGYVAYAVDGQFRVALAPTAEMREKMHQNQEFVFVWDTKAPIKVRGGVTSEIPKDGQHELSATLYVPKEGQAGGSTPMQTSSVKVTLANKIAGTDPGPIRLRYSFQDGSNRTYQRDGNVAIVVGLTQGMQGSSDQELVGQRSNLLVAVEDKYENGNAIVRNKLTKLTVRQGGQETTYPADQLPKSLYQELTPTGEVKYQNETVSFEQFAQLGIPVDTTINLPMLPRQSVRVGDKWQSEKREKLDIPGTPPNKQPEVVLTSILEGIEWEGGYPTAKIHQSYDSSKGGFKLASVVVGSVDVENPTVTYERDIYLAYKSGTLVKINRTITIVGKTTQQFGAAAGANAGIGAGAGGGMLGGMPGGPMGMMGGNTMPSMRGPMGAAGGGMASGGRSGGGSRGPAGGGAGARRGGGGGMMGGSRRPGGGAGMMMGAGGRGGAPGGGMGSNSSRMPGGRSGMMGMGAGMMPGGAGAGMMPGGSMGGFQPQATSQITLKSTTNTQLAGK